MTYHKLTALGSAICRKLTPFAAAGLMMMSVASCEKQLEEDPYSYYAANTFFKNVNQATMATMGVYDILGEQSTYGFYLSLAYAIDTDIAQVQGNVLNDEKRILAHYGVSPTHPWLRETWRVLYIGIDRANLVIRKIPEMELYKNGTEDQKKTLDRLLGEAQFLRALYYFDLVRLWGDVPLKTTPTQSPTEQLQLPRTNREQVYDQIIADLKAAAATVPWNSAKGQDERVSKGAVKGILARVYLYRGGYSLRQDGTMKRPDNYRQYYDSALTQTKAIIASGEHTLNNSYEQVFRNYCSLKLEPKESMFEVALFNPLGQASNSGVIGTWNSPLCDAASPYGRANSFYVTHPLFQKTFEKNDLRRDVAVANFQIDKNGNTVPLTGTADAKWAPGKWRRNWQGTSPKDPNNTDINWVLLRYADVLLMQAEAENEVNGPTQVAYNAVNEVRHRAGLPDLTPGLAKEAFFNALVDERAHELCFEGFRKWDLIRWNMLGAKIRATQTALKAYRANFPYVAGDNFQDGKHELFPIPQRERDENPTLTQNPKY
ncbi:Starch-binding associating with outer membrane [Chitinophaga eiseniae]|uniref:Starch-binding associating with outer membrane n=1 Tax=Chitinophaga eiseniae TaxID=634771 RepID=A0A1T4TTI4_9BACT|nr:RagB/SusD family nutrient uptake outer membrane protein [Chitinophaga eiseniae]SKA43499.1 Starch-binding associating with outer membrane [Chitinophaga eiseniae]